MRGQRRRIQRAAEQKAATEARPKARPRRQGPIIVAIIVILLAFIVGGVVYYRSYVAPFQRPVMSVDGTVIKMDYFLKRARLSGIDPMTLLQQLTAEVIIKERAPQFGLEVTATDIDDALLYAASTENITADMADDVTARYLTEPEFRAWYRRQLRDTGLSDTEYKDMARANLLAARLQEYLAQSIPATAEQVRLNVILLANAADAEKARARIAAGESFASVAGKVSLDTQSRSNGGDVGWMPRGVFPNDGVIFALGIGEVSAPVPADSSSPGTSQYLLFMVSQKDANRQVDDSSMQVLRSNVVMGWLAQEIALHTVRYDYLNFDAETLNWVNWQLARASR